MKIMIWVGHPKHVHFWKNIVKNLLDHGHKVKILAVEKDITLHLLDAYGLEYEIVGKNYNGLLSKAYGLIRNDVRSFFIAKKFKPDILAAGISLTHISKLIGKPSIFFSDTEHADFANNFSFPFSNIICTPSCYKGKVDPKKHLEYNGYEELSYLHPNYFKSDASILENIGLNIKDKFILLRFVSWNASHDIGHQGIDRDSKYDFITKLEQYGRVFISSESKLSKEFEKYNIVIPPEKLHSLLSYAQLYIGESGAMTTEAAILGTPSIYISSLAGKMGNFDELEKRYELVHSFNNSKAALEMAVNLLEDRSLKIKWQKKREKLLSEKIDVVKFMTEFIENYPESFKKYQSQEIRI